MRLDRRSLITILGGTGTTVALAGCVTSEEDADGSGNGDDGNGDDGGNGNGNGDEGGNGNGDDNGGNGDDADESDEGEEADNADEGNESDEADDEEAAFEPREPGEARMWHVFADGEIDDLEAAIGRFESETDHAINDEEVSELQDQLNTALPVGEGPDMYAFAHDWVGPFEERGWLHDLGEDLNLDVEDTYTSAAVEAISWNDGIYGLPYAAETVGLLYNREMVDSVPETVEEMVEIMEDHHDPEAGEYGISYPLDDPYFVSAWVHAFGGYYYDDEEDELGFTNEETIEGLELLVENFWSYAPADPGYESQVAVFNDGNAPFAINGPWQVGGFRDAGIDVGVAKLPTADGNEPSPYTGVQLWYLTHEVEDDDDAKRAALDFAEWYTTSEEVIVDNANNHGFIPVNEQVIEEGDLGEDVDAFAENVEIGRPMPTSPKMEQVWEPASDALQRILNDEQTPEEAFEQAEEEVRSNWEEQDY